MPISDGRESYRGAVKMSCLRYTGTLVGPHIQLQRLSLWAFRNLCRKLLFMAAVVRFALFLPLLPLVRTTHHSCHPSPFHSFITGLKPSFSANPSHRSLLFFFRTGSTDSPDCLPIFLSMSVFTFFLFSFFPFLVIGFVR